eukprot:m.932022 g.932022  ORF g.932022 m.932022 type:complete len:826 (-) comp23785_c0_seq41:178-2655(-)
MAGQMKLTQLWFEASQMQSKGEFAMALAKYNESETMMAKMCFNVGSIHLQSGNLKDAIISLTQTIEKDAYLAIGYFARGVANFKSQKYAAALADFSKTLTLFRGTVLIDYTQLGMNTKLYMCDVYLNGGLAAQANGNQTEASEYFSSASADDLHVEDYHAAYTLQAVPSLSIVELDLQMNFAPDRKKVEALKKKKWYKESEVQSSWNNDTSTDFKGDNMLKQIEQEQKPKAAKRNPKKPPARPAYSADMLKTQALQQRLPNADKAGLPTHIARYDYDPGYDGDLELRVGDHITLKIDNEDGWYTGYSTRTKMVGVFPAEFVEELSDAELSALEAQQQKATEPGAPLPPPPVASPPTTRSAKTSGGGAGNLQALLADTAARAAAQSKLSKPPPPVAPGIKKLPPPSEKAASVGSGSTPSATGARKATVAVLPASHKPSAGGSGSGSRSNSSGADDDGASVAESGGRKKPPPMRRAPTLNDNNNDSAPQAAPTKPPPTAAAPAKPSPPKALATGSSKPPAPTGNSRSGVATTTAPPPAMLGAMTSQIAAGAASLKRTNTTATAAKRPEPAGGNDGPAFGVALRKTSLPGGVSAGGTPGGNDGGTATKAKVFARGTSLPDASSNTANFHSPVQRKFGGVGLKKTSILEESSSTDDTTANTAGGTSSVGDRLKKFQSNSTPLPKASVAGKAKPPVVGSAKPSLSASKPSTTASFKGSPKKGGVSSTASKFEQVSNSPTVQAAAGATTKTIVLKVHYLETRRVQVSTDTTTDELKTMLKEKFNLNDDVNLWNRRSGKEANIVTQHTIADIDATGNTLWCLPEGQELTLQS